MNQSQTSSSSWESLVLLSVLFALFVDTDLRPRQHLKPIIAFAFVLVSFFPFVARYFRTTTLYPWSRVTFLLIYSPMLDCEMVEPSSLKIRGRTSRLKYNLLSWGQKSDVYMRKSDVKYSWPKSDAYMRICVLRCQTGLCICTYAQLTYPCHRHIGAISNKPFLYICWHKWSTRE